MSTQKRWLTSLDEWLTSQSDLPRIGPDVIEFLKNPITVKDRRGPIYVYVESIEPPDAEGSEFVRFSFRLRRRPDPTYQGPRIENGSQPGMEAQKARRRAKHGNMFTYVFCSLNSREENLQNLTDFVRRQSAGSTRAKNSGEIIARPVGPVTDIRRRPKIAVAMFALAAGILLAVTLLSTPSGSTPDWGWARPGALAQNVPRAEYLRNLASQAGEFDNSPVQTKAQLVKRLTEMRSGCKVLFKSPHEPLTAADRTWLKGRCKVWSSQIDGLTQQISQLPDDRPVKEERQESEAVIGAIIAELDKRSQSP